VAEGWLPSSAGTPAEGRAKTLLEATCSGFAAGSREWG
jgi:hypothetical protein